MTAPAPEARPGAGVLAFPDSEDAARRLAGALDVPCANAERHVFPDGERLVRVPAAFAQTLVYRPLNDWRARDPDDRLIEVLLAASALRAAGARTLTLIAPYLPYMRQDTAFRPGEAVSQAVIGRLIGAAFDRLLAVEPHLHRTATLAEACPGAAAEAVSAAPALARLLGEGTVSPDTLVLGPDAESAPLARGLARLLGLDWAVAAKTRRGDREVAMRLPDSAAPAGRPVVLVDDMVSTGTTLMECARLARAAGAAGVEAVVVHALFPPDRQGAFREAGIARIRSADGLPHPTNAAPLAPVLAAALRPAPAGGDG